MITAKELNAMVADYEAAKRAKNEQAARSFIEKTVEPALKERAEEGYRHETIRIYDKSLVGEARRILTEEGQFKVVFDGVFLSIRW